ncbi:hypothetical protein NQ317_003916 [Molorchus minor]|uniref:Uncharacterized protein n=1 Tax=Molorchus minor TaxID=1323400 RepID=A0ABQ9J986_9CUCU|nr:hypothetical protein NQ317_003916 [Molorchus minor]
MGKSKGGKSKGGKSVKTEVEYVVPQAPPLVTAPLQGTNPAELPFKEWSDQDVNSEKWTADSKKCTMNNCESEEIVEAANIAISNLLPTKSRSLYDIAYNRFKKWCAEKNVQVYSENVLLAYFSENAKNYKSSTLWAQYSMVKSCLIIYDNIDISKFPKLIAFLKRNGYQAKKIENIDKE